MIRNNVAKLIKSKDITIEAFAEWLHLDPRLVKRLAKNPRSIPDIEVVGHFTRAGYAFDEIIKYKKKTKKQSLEEKEKVLLNRIEEIVESEGISYYAFAKKYGIHPSQLYLWRDDRSKLPSTAMVAKIIDIGGYAFEDLFEYIEEDYEDDDFVSAKESKKKVEVEGVFNHPRLI